MEDYRDRLRAFLEANKIKPAYFVEKMDFSNGLINKLIKKEIHLGVEKLELILNHFSDLNPRWLFTGEGDKSWTIEAMGHPIVQQREEVLVDKLIDVAKVKNEFSGQIEDLRKHLETKEELVAMQKEKIKALELQIEQQSKSIKQLNPANT